MTVILWRTDLWNESTQTADACERYWNIALHSLISESLFETTEAICVFPVTFDFKERGSTYGPIHLSFLGENDDELFRAPYICFDQPRIARSKTAPLPFPGY